MPTIFVYYFFLEEAWWVFFIFSSQFVSLSSSVTHPNTNTLSSHTHSHSNSLYLTHTPTHTHTQTHSLFSEFQFSEVAEHVLNRRAENHALWQNWAPLQQKKMFGQKIWKPFQVWQVNAPINIMTRISFQGHACKRTFCLIGWKKERENKYREKGESKRKLLQEVLNTKSPITWHFLL